MAIEPVGHGNDGAPFRLSSRLAVLFWNRRHIQGSRSARRPMEAQGRDVCHKVMAADDTHALDGDAEAVEAVLVKRHGAEPTRFA